MSARVQKKIRREVGKMRRDNAVRFDKALRAARKEQIRRAIIGAIIIAAFAFAISRVMG